MQFGTVLYLPRFEFKVNYYCGARGGEMLAAPTLKESNDLRGRFTVNKGRGKRARYNSDYPAMLYRFFVGYDGAGAPSFDKFARSIGATREDIELFRSHERFARSYRECSEIRRDYLIDNALTRRFDPSFVKFLLGEESDASGGDELAVSIKVIDG